MDNLSFVFLGALICAVLMWFMPNQVEEKKSVITKTCYVTEWKWEKSSNGVRVRVPVKQVCVKGEQDETE